MLKKIKVIYLYRCLEYTLRPVAGIFRDGGGGGGDVCMPYKTGIK